MSDENLRGVRGPGVAPRRRDEPTTKLSVPHAGPAPGRPPIGPAEPDTQPPVDAPPPPAPATVSSAADTLEYETLSETPLRGVLIGIVGRLHSLIVPIGTGDGILGRAPENTYVIDDLYLSKQAANLVVDEAGVALSCIEGAKRIEINGQPVDEPVWLRDGDQLKLGSTLFSFRTTTPEAESQ